MGTFDTRGGVARHDPAFDAPDFFTTDEAIKEARNLGLRVTFAQDKVSEAGGFGVPYAAHDNDASRAFVALVELAGDKSA